MDAAIIKIGFVNPFRRKVGLVKKRQWQFYRFAFASRKQCKSKADMDCWRNEKSETQIVNCHLKEDKYKFRHK